MAGNPLEIHPAALAELKSSVQWCLERSEPAALKFVTEVDQAIELVMELPNRWLAGDHGTRRLVLQRFPYAIIYWERKVDVQVLAVAHGHRRPGYWKQRR